jgi:hypothetical protein
MTRSSLVTIVTILRPGPSGIRFLAVSEDFSFLQSSHNGSEAQPASNTKTGVFFPGVKQAEREDDHSPPSGAEIKNEWSHNSSPPMWFG